MYVSWDTKRNITYYKSVSPPQKHKHFKWYASNNTAKKYMKQNLEEIGKYTIIVEIFYILLSIIDRTTVPKLNWDIYISTPLTKGSHQQVYKTPTNHSREHIFY